MSEAVNPAMNPSHSFPDDSVPPHDHANTSQVKLEQQDTEEAWETVDFPGALSVDRIPLERATSSTPEAIVVVPETQAGDRQLWEQLQQENVALRTQLSLLEEDLSQAQIELQLEVARFYCKEAETAAADSMSDRIDESLQSAEAQIQQTVEAWQASHQFIQQQEATLASLVQQLERSQHRTAQLERDCTLSQQRYSEQVQLVAQVENTCQDLRMRLHRQQQQTLQFKAALEKSIEMNTVATVTATQPTAIAQSEPVSPSKDDNPFIQKARPVQPWSVAPETTAHPHGSSRQQTSGLPSLLAKLAKQPPLPLEPVLEPTAAIEPNSSLDQVSATLESVIETQAVPVPTVSMDAASKNVLEFLFPTQTAAIANVPQAQASVFDLSSFVEAGEIDPERISNEADVSPMETVVHQPEPEAKPAPRQSKPAGEGLWADLARLIEPNLTEAELSSLSGSFESGASKPGSHQETPATASTVPQTAEPITRPTTSTEVNKPISLVSFSYGKAENRLETQNSLKAPDIKETVVVSNPFPSFTLRADETSATVAETAIAQPSERRSLDPNSDKVPSPILYPTRPSKKLASMAAVDLPSFPRR